MRHGTGRHPNITLMETFTALPPFACGGTQPSLFDPGLNMEQEVEVQLEPPHSTCHYPGVHGLRDLGFLLRHQKPKRWRAGTQRRK